MPEMASFSCDYFSHAIVSCPGLYMGTHIKLCHTGELYYRSETPVLTRPTETGRFPFRVRISSSIVLEGTSPGSVT